MTTERLIHKILNDRMHITIDDCDRLLSHYRYTAHKKGGSHRTYHTKGDTPIIVVIPKHSRFVKPGYVDMLIKRLHLKEGEW